MEAEAWESCSLPSQHRPRKSQNTTRRWLMAQNPQTKHPESRRGHLLPESLEGILLLCRCLHKAWEC